MDKNQLAIVTISLVRNAEEEKALRQSLEALAALQVPVFITDGGSPNSFLSFLESLPAFTVSTAKGLWPQAKASIAAAAETSVKWLLYTEPDKLIFFAEHLQQMMEAVAVNENTGVVLASRLPGGFQTFPPFQQMTETAINNCCKEVIGEDIDYCYGPFLFTTRLVPYLDALPAECGWGWRPYLFAMAHRLHLSVEAFEAAFQCPDDQRNKDERLYRMKQLTQNIEGLLLAASMNLP